MVFDRNKREYVNHCVATGPRSREDRRDSRDPDAIDRAIEPSYEITEFQVVNFRRQLDDPFAIRFPQSVERPYKSATVRVFPNEDFLKIFAYKMGGLRVANLVASSGNASSRLRTSTGPLLISAQESRTPWSKFWSVSKMAP